MLTILKPLVLKLKKLPVKQHLKSSCHISDEEGVDSKFRSTK